MCEIEISHMGKNNGKPDLVCENFFSFFGKMANLNTSFFITCQARHPISGHVRPDFTCILERR